MAMPYRHPASPFCASHRDAGRHIPVRQHGQLPPDLWRIFLLHKPRRQFPQRTLNLGNVRKYITKRRGREIRAVPDRCGHYGQHKTHLRALRHRAKCWSVCWAPVLHREFQSQHRPSRWLFLGRHRRRYDARKPKILGSMPRPRASGRIGRLNSISQL
jgi:hypothetical protein